MNTKQEQELPVLLSEPQVDVLASRTALTLDMAGQGAGKTENIGFSTGHKITNFPMAKGFIAANTYMQLNQSTLNKAFKVWERFFDLYEYDAKNNPEGDYVLDKLPPAHFKRFEKLKSYNSTISFKNGCLIFVGSLDNYKAHDGKEFAWAELDETKDTKKEALTTVILARLRQYGLWADQNGEQIWDSEISLERAAELKYKSFNPCVIHTSPAEGGVDWIIDLFGLAQYEEDIRIKLADPYDYFFKQDKETTTVIYQTYWNEANLPPNFIASRKAQLTESEQMKFIDGYPFSKTGGEYYPPFNRKQHVGKVEHDPAGLTHLTYDFNVMPYVTQIAVEVTYVTRYWHEKELKKYNTQEQDTIPFDVMRIAVYKEYLMKSPYNTTEHAAQAFVDDIEEGTYPDILVHGDSSGRNRITGLGSLTQYKIIEGKLINYLPSNWMQVPRANVAILKRRDLLNRILDGKIPEVEFIISDECPETIRDFEFLKQHPDGSGKYKEKAKDPNTGKEYEKIGHISDAVEYLVTDLCKQYMRVF